MQETGACSCKLNVGSDMDDRCCNCTPGYFNFTDQGCQGGIDIKIMIVNDNCIVLWFQLATVVH